MLNRISDFYRIVHPDPPDTLITQRKEAIIGFVEQFSDRELRYSCAEIGAFGLGPTGSSTRASAAHSIVGAIQTTQPSFSSDIVANAVDLRAFAGIAVGEYLSTSTDEATAALVISALGTRPLPQERYLAEFVSALLDTARRSIETSAHSYRERPELEIGSIQGTDFTALSKSVKTALDALKEGVDRRLRVNQEELDILWWVFGGHSTSMDKPFQALDLSQRILAAASELAELVVAPPPKGSVQFLHAVLKEDRPLSLRHLIEPCSSELLASLARRRAETGTVLTGHPALLPLIWISNRRVESGMTAGWEAEFEQKTHISVGDERTASRWAQQVFNECVAAKLLATAGDQD